MWQGLCVGMSPYKVLWAQNRPAVVAQWLTHPTGNLGVPGPAPQGVEILFMQIPPFKPQKRPTVV